MNEKNLVNLCFITDEGYIMQTCVAITSILKCKLEQTKYAIYVICNNVTRESIDNLKKLEENNFEIKIIELNDDGKYLRYDIKNIPASPAAMYKFSIPNILKDIDKVIYLDGDIIVRKDLIDLFKIDILDNYVGAVKETGGLSRTLYNLFIKNNVFYFNSGVMLMNLKQMRKDNITDKLIEYRLNGYNELMDQDALNVVLKNKVLELPFKYNTQLMFMYMNSAIHKIRKFYKLDETIMDYDSIIGTSVVLHYSGKKKPWKHLDGFMHEIWVYNYYSSPYKNKLLSRCIFKNNKSNKFISLIKREKKNIRRYKFMKQFSN